MKRLITLILLAVISYTMIAIGAHRWLTVSDGLQKADAIVAISGGDTQARTLRAVELYKQGWADVLIFSGAALDPLSPSNAEIMKNIAAVAGVDEADILIAETAQNTAENALETTQIINVEGFDSIILVTSPYHQRRAGIEFEQKLGPDVNIVNYSSADKLWSEDRWFIEPRSTYLLWSEVAKSMFVTVRGVF